ncbi:MAG: TolC family protein, partial [Planctomycetaceae bacterium]|nr:TolC family protein [Planctomycetaceae bacterium]
MAFTRIPLNKINSGNHLKTGMLFRPLTLLTISSILFITSGCSYFGNWLHNGFKVGPDYCKPEAPVADEWIDSYSTQIKEEYPNESAWWEVFNDPQLNALVQLSYDQNLTLQAAGMRVVEARAQRGIVVGEFFPQGQEMFGQYSRNQLSKNTFPGSLPGFPRASGFWSGGFDAVWEIDVWGRFRRNIESADASLDASVEDYDNFLVILIADTAATYVEYRTLQQQLVYARNNVETQKITLGIAEAQFKAGAVSELDPLQAMANLRQTEQTIPLLEAQLRNTNLALCTLLGIPPRDLSSELGKAPIPTAPADVAVGIPADLLRRRPDVL